MNQVITFEQQAEKLSQALSNLKRSIAEAGRIVVEMLDAFPGARDRLAEQYAEIPQRMWSMLEKVGRGTLDGRIALGCPYSFQLQRLPLSEQRRALDESLDLALPGGDTCKVRLQDATPEQARLLIGETGIRSVEAQAVRLHADKAIKTRPVRAALSYDLSTKRGEVTFTARERSSLTLTKVDILDILRRLG